MSLITKEKNSFEYILFENNDGLITHFSKHLFNEILYKN